MSQNGKRIGASARRFGASRSGNIAMLWALVGGVLVALVGLTVDFTRAQSVRAQMQNAVDGAALVAERSSNLTLAQRESAARAYFDQTLGTQPIDGAVTFRVISLADGGHRVEASATFDNGMSLLAGMFNNRNKANWSVAVAAEAQSEASPPIEVALVLDNTGSMSADMQSLRDAAEDLASDLLALDGDTVSVALVPFVAQVNIGNGATQMAWMDVNGNAPYNGELLEDRQIGVRTWSSSMGANCQNISTLPYTGYTGTYRIVWIRQGSTCRAMTPDSINYFTLYSYLPSTAAWKGCVEMRPEPYDVTDEPPSAANPATLFVPFFWIDTGGDRCVPSGSATNCNSTSSSAANYQSYNSYLTDSRGAIVTTSPTTAMSAGTTTSPSAQEARIANWLNVFKYRGDTSSSYVSFDNTGPDTRGPNRGCPTPILPLTNDRDAVINNIRAMQHWNGGGTNQAEGLAWGWRVLSHGAPFTQGRDPAVEDVRKVLVLMSDGENTNVGSDAVFSSDYSSLNHLGLWTSYADGSVLTSLLGVLNATVGGVLHGLLPTVYRRNIHSSSQFVTYINNREQTVCQNIKNDGIEIYTVIFRETDTTTENLMRACASGNDHFYRADNAQQLAQAFNAIGSGIGQLRLTR